MNEVDWVILAVLALSTIVGVSRGLVREILAIVGWVLAILLALKFAPMVGEAIPLPSLSILVRTALGAVLVVVAHLMAAASITFEDRAIGAIFGLVRGVVIVCACVFVLGLTSATKTGLWRNSVLIVPCEHVIDFCMPYMPQTIVDLRRGKGLNI